MQKQKPSRAYQLQYIGHHAPPNTKPKVEVQVHSRSDRNPDRNHRTSKQSNYRPPSPSKNISRMAMDSDKVPLLAGNQSSVRGTDVAEHRFSTISDQLGINEIDDMNSISSGSQQHSHNSKEKGNSDSPTIVLTQEQVDTLIETLESTGETLKQLTLRHNEYKPPRRPRIPRWITTHLFAITVLWQFMCIMAITVLDAFTRNKKKERLTFILTIAILVLFQFVNLLLIFITSVKLTKQFMHHTVTRSFLGQSYLSMTLLFAGLYTLLYRIDSSCFKDLGGLGVPNDALGSVVLFINMLFYSISIGTLCGAGHAIAAIWYAQMITSVQMLMSYVYFASVLSTIIHSPKHIKYKLKRDASVNSNGRNYGAIKNV